MEACRPAGSGDLARIVELARGLRDEVRGVRGGDLWTQHEARPEPLDEEYAALLESPDARVVVGTVDDVVLGFAVGELEALHDGATLGVVSDLYVEPEGRGVAIGEAMVEELLAWFSDRGCTGVDAWALPGHRMTKNFFEGHGFVSRGIVVHRPLARPIDPPPDPSDSAGPADPLDGAPG